MDALDFTAAVGSDPQAVIFVGHWLAPLFDAPYAVDSRKIDGVWVHQLHEPQTDTAALRAQLAVAWLRRREADAKEWTS